jgi:hypothetical protein
MGVFRHRGLFSYTRASLAPQGEHCRESSGGDVLAAWPKGGRA